MTTNSSHITSERRKELPSRGKAKKTLMIDAIRAVCDGGEEEFLQKVVAIGLGGWTKPDKKDEEPIFQQPNQVLLSLALNRIEPPLKPVSPMVDFAFDPKSKPHEQATQVLSAAADGVISPDVAKMFIESIATMLKIQEITDFEDRLKAIEDAAEQG